MSGHRSASSALSRALVVVIVLGGAVIGTAGTALAASGTEDPTTSAAVPSGTAIAGMSLGTLAWALVGFLVLAAGFIAASRSGRRDQVATVPGLSSGTAGRSYQASARDAQGEPTAAAVVV